MCFNVSSFYGCTWRTLLLKELKSPVNRNWSSVYLLSLLPMEILRIKFWAISFRRLRFTAIYIASNPDNDVFLADKPLGQNRPENRWNLRSFFTVLQLWMEIHSLLLPVNSSRLPLVKRPSRITGISVLPVVRYQIFSIRICWSCRFYLYNTILILLLRLYVYSFFYFWPSYSPGNNTKK